MINLKLCDKNTSRQKKHLYAKNKSIAVYFVAEESTKSLARNTLRVILSG